MADCPCCANRMLRHIRNQQLYWFCRSCWQVMPVLNSPMPNYAPSSLNKNLQPASLYSLIHR